MSSINTRPFRTVAPRRSSGNSTDRKRRTQPERSAATQEALLDATIDCLVDFGYAGTTTTLVCQRAGVSRGAQVHHFPTKADLVSHAVDHLARRRIDDLRRKITTHGRRKNPAAAILGLWSAFEGPLFIAATELWIAARLDADLRNHLRPIERQIGHLIAELATEIFPDEIVARPDFHQSFEVVVNVMRGMAITAVIRETPLAPTDVVDVATQVLRSTP